MFLWVTVLGNAPFTGDLYGLTPAWQCIKTTFNIKNIPNLLDCSCILSDFQSITVAPLLYPHPSVSPSLSLSQHRSAAASSTPARQVTSPPQVILWSTRLTRTVTGSSRRRSPRSASSSTSTHTLRSRGWTASKTGRGGGGKMGDRRLFIDVVPVASINHSFLSE